MPRRDQAPHTPFSSTKTLTWKELQQLELTTHVMLLVEDWNEPDTFEVYESYIVVRDDITFVTTAVRMTFLGYTTCPDSISDTVLVATYHDDQVKDVACFAEDGALAYATNRQDAR